VFDGRINGVREQGPNRSTRLDLQAETLRAPLALVVGSISDQSGGNEWQEGVGTSLLPGGRRRPDVRRHETEALATTNDPRRRGKASF
jgi:hypothetical protein